MRSPAAILLLALLAAGCGPQEPLSVERAMAICAEEARRATSPTGSVMIGVGSGGDVSAGVVVGVTPDYLVGRDPEEVYDNCVVARSGEAPTKPLEAMG